MKNKRDTVAKELLASMWPKTKEEIQNAVARDFFGAIFKGLGEGGTLFSSEDTFGEALRVAVEIFCDDIYDLNPEFEGNFYMDDGFLIPLIQEPQKVNIRSANGCKVFEVKSELAGALLWCAALNKASKIWISNQSPEKAEFCLEIMRDLLRELPVHLTFKKYIHELSEWQDILKNQVPNL